MLGVGNNDFVVRVNYVVVVVKSGGGSLFCLIHLTAPPFKCTRARAFMSARAHLLQLLADTRCLKSARISAQYKSPRALKFAQGRAGVKSNE